MSRDWLLPFRSRAITAITCDHPIASTTNDLTGS